jgi:hypothetical protein
MDDNRKAAQLEPLYGELHELEGVKESAEFSRKSSKERSEVERNIRRCRERIKSLGGEVETTPEEWQADRDEIGGG